MSTGAPRLLHGHAEQRLRDELVALHQVLVDDGLVVWTSGNVSARVPGQDRFLIKPSGVDYGALTADAMVLCTFDGAVVPGSLGGDGRPSSDTMAHAVVYREMPEVGGVVHTHSPYATAWAAVGEPVPCVLTSMCDEFGGEIPIGPVSVIGDDSIGLAIVDTLRGHRSPAVLMQNHGPFAIGPTARAAVKAAAMAEDAARAVFLARQLGDPIAIDPALVDALYERYQTAYGQPLTGG